MRKYLLIGIVVIALAGCAAHLPTAHLAATASPVAQATLAETWISPPATGEELDSLTAWPTPQGPVWLIATAKASHRLIVYDGDTGYRLRTIGSPGQGLGQFNRPNGITVFGDLLFVVERDNHRIQVLQLPDFTPLAQFGQDLLKAPYGLWLNEIAPEQWDLFVTDNYMADIKTRQAPPLSQLDQRVKHFRLQRRPDGSLQARLLSHFGATEPAGALRMVESIAGDPAHNRLLIAEEDRQTGSTLRDYDLSGHYRGFSLPIFDGDAEGVALWACTPDQGYWIAVDQRSPTLFRLFDRRTLQARGVFRGQRVSNTDGQTLYAASTPRFPAGALFVLHNDQSLAAFDLRQLATALNLSNGCAA